MGIRVVACHQPNFIPWLGYFAKVLHSDEFFLLDDVQFTQGRNKHNWTTRVRILMSDHPLWLSVPVMRSGQGRQLIRDVRIDRTNGRWLKKLTLTLEQAYGKCPCFDEYYPHLSSILSKGWDELCPLNIELIRWVARLLSIDGRLRLSSETKVLGESNQRLIGLTKAAGGSVYLSGDGADEYQVIEEFRTAGISLQKMGFQHPRYPQGAYAGFVAGLSILDVLFRIGAEETRALLERSRPHPERVQG